MILLSRQGGLVFNFIFATFFVTSLLSHNIFVPHNTNNKQQKEKWIKKAENDAADADADDAQF